MAGAVERGQQFPGSNGVQGCPEAPLEGHALDLEKALPRAAAPHQRPHAAGKPALSQQDQQGAH
eukprot:9414334-Pyramimonas_sp.AAC.1